MFVKAVMYQRLAIQPNRWNHNLNRYSPVVVLGLKTPAEWGYNSTFVSADEVSCFFMVTRFRNVVRFYYSLEIFQRGKIVREDGDFEGFDSVSGEFRGIRFHWSRESGKVFITDAVAQQREFDTLKIE